MHGQFVWYELTTPDSAAAQKFYPRFTGWGTLPFDKDYVMFTHGGAPVAGIFGLTDEMKQQGVPPNWMPYVETDNVDETVRKATSLGGRVVAPAGDIPNVGRYAVLADPQGAVFGVYKSIHPSRSWDGTNVVGQFSWHELMTDDHPKAFEFYRALFGWAKVDEMDMGGGSMYLMYGHGKKMYGGMYNRMPGMEGMPPFWLVYIHVKDVARAVEIATKAGATVHRPQMDIPGGAIAILGDPQGAGFAVHHANVQAVATTTGPAKTPAKSAAKAPAKPAAKAPAKPAAKAPAKAAAKKKPAAKATARKPARAAKRVASKPKAKAKAKAKSRPKAKPKAAPRKSSAPARKKGRLRKR
jgi:predicted enzyme related to lactoylglutathione lyase